MEFIIIVVGLAFLICFYRWEKLTFIRNEEEGWVMLAAAVIGAGAAIYGSNQSSKTAKGNEKLAAQAAKDEMARREAAAAEAGKAMEAYNKLREERPGLTFREWANERIQALDDPALKEIFRKTKKEDFEEAQMIADAATKGNISTFEYAIDKISGGKSTEMLRRRNELALTADTASAFKRALELESTAIPAGSVQLNERGELVRGQRADKQLFTTAFEVDERQRDKQFRMLRDIVNDDRTLADRQQERAKDFLQFAGYTDYASNLSDQAMKTRIGFQMQDEQNQFQLIRDFNAAAFSDQTAQPTFRSTAGSDALTAAGIDLAIKGLASYNQNQNKGTGYQQTTTPAYTVDGYQVRRATYA